VCYFCPDDPACQPCTDADNDTFAVEGGSCGPVDCNDNNPAINPDAAEIPNNGIDDDCSGGDLVDPDLLDTDLDGYTPADGDCDDDDPAIHPGAAENCTDTIDNDCDDLVDDQDPDAVGCPPDCADSDGDNFAIDGGACGPVDCDDTDPAINPQAADIPNNGIDEDCDGSDAVDLSLLDNDGDQFTVAAGDCNDSDPTINPAAEDIPNNGIDEDCNGSDAGDVIIVDNDGDGFTLADGDCDDNDGAVNPNAVELCTDGVDNDCDGLIDTQDPGATDCPPACTDNDSDNYAVEGGDCGPVDCDDWNADMSPGAVEICDDLIDNDCDQLTDEGCDPSCPDNDDDGYLDAGCGGADCDDTDATINPETAEVCGNGIDENCNGDSDDICTTCPDGTQLILKTARYSQRRQVLTNSGRANSNTHITVFDSDTGEILVSDLRVRNGRFQETIDHLPPDQIPVRVTAINDEGCVSAEMEVGMRNRPGFVDNDDELEEEHSYHIFSRDRHYDDD